MKYENRRYNKDETSKEFYIRRTKNMKKVEILENMIKKIKKFL